MKAQSWQFNGDVAASLERLTLNGELEANSGARADLDLRYPFDAALTVGVESRLSGKRGSDSWAALVKAWPTTLEIEEGTVVASATLTQPQNSPAGMSGTLEIEGLAGTYDRMAWTGLDSYLTADLHQNLFTVQTDNLSFAQINPGITIKSVTLAGSYQARSDTPETGKLMLKEANAGLLGGDVRVKPQTWDLSQWPIQIALDVNRLQLSELMALYPAENLSGTGILSGQLPLGIGPEGVNVADGEIRALEPGGRLQLPGGRLQALAQDNAAMQIVAEAMKNFHYSVLSSTIGYAQDGTLLLDLHIEGNNPNVRAGQPVVLNINLEENIPALLTTLQLSGRVNEAVTERVKKLIERQQSDDSSELEIKGGIE